MSSVSQHTVDRAENVADVVAVEDLAPGMKRVVSFGGCYVVDARDGGCLCPDKEYNEVPMCKHEWAAMLADVGHYPAPFMQADDLDHRPEETRDEPTRSEPADFGGGESTGVQTL